MLKLSRLDVISPAFIAIMWSVVAVAAAAAVHARLRRRRRSVLARRLALCLLAIVVATADSVNAHYAYLPTISDAAHQLPLTGSWTSYSRVGRLGSSGLQRARQSGLVVTLNLADHLDGTLDHTRAVVFLPPQYFQEPARRFPTVYLLHGSPGRPEDWFYAGRAEHFGRAVANAGTPAILVAPQMSRSWLDDSECLDTATEPVETRFVRVVIPAIDETFRTLPSRTDRTFVGMSAGGYCALNLALRHRDVVATVIDLSGEVAPSHSGGLARLFGRKTPDLASLIAANSPITYVPALPPTPNMRIWLDCGKDDHGIRRHLGQMASELSSRGFQVMLRIRPGGHTYYVWKAALAEALPWALNFPQDPARPTRSRMPA